MSITTYPKSINEFGSKHRRTHIRFIDYPKVYGNLENAETLFIEFLQFKERVKGLNFDLTEFEKSVKLNYEKAWLDYYGIDAYEHLMHYYGKDCVQWVEFHERLTQLLA